jgi:hypothetical protein
MFVYTCKRYQNQESETKSIHSIYEVHEKCVDVDSQVFDPEQLELVALDICCW